ncbi:hypothetical protein G8770_03230 [Aestuariicella hydrocarbonica]|uniref:Tetratricopeptide repeat protein n=1 Tax=Pseudomaricurvus hydrocarbonicus TaxID=1470433 RepID=A0A9E5JQD9_9GAMM|nr:hypothetical protein [Aestuariicella hydrocarbonica]NHO64559.1 hypothetical protein [Aestuariicella hydrocarbonica]
MMRTRALSLLFLPFSLLVQAGSEKIDSPRDAFFGEALFYASQDEWFDAISRLDTELKLHHGVDEPQLDQLHYYVNDAEFSVGDFELSYRVHRQAGRAIKAVIEGNVEPEVRNEAIYRLAKIYFQKEQNLNAFHAIERVEGDLPEGLEDDLDYLKGQIYMVNGRFEAAEKIFKSLSGSDEYEGYAGFNQGLSQIAQGSVKAAGLTLDSVGRLNSDDRAVLAMKDRANLTLGSRLMDAGEPQAATQFLERVRLDGPYSNRALLGLGWASASFDDYEKALVPWTILSQRHVTDPAVQNALLGVPYAYGKLGLFGKAALGYGHALSMMNAELDRLDASIASIREGNFLEALVREEIKLDRNWVIKLRELPETPETYYLMDLMASHDFQSSLQNYFDLEQLRKKLERWVDDYAAFEDVIDLRRRYYEPLLPAIDEQFRKLDSLINLRLEQRDRIDRRLQAMLVAPRPDFLATSQERLMMRAIEAAESTDVARSEDGQRRINRLKGVLTWQWETEYHERLTTTFEHLIELDKDIARLNEIYNSFVRTRQAATQSYQGYDQQITHMRQKTERAQATVKTLMLRQGRMLEMMAIDELQKRSQQLEVAQVKARFALAESYDRATMKKSGISSEGMAQQDKPSSEPPTPDQRTPDQRSPGLQQEDAVQPDAAQSDADKLNKPQPDSAKPAAAEVESPITEPPLVEPTQAAAAERGVL